MKVTRLKLWAFRIEFDSGRAYTVNRRGSVWAFGPEGGLSTHTGPTLCETLGKALTVGPQAVDKIVELLVESGGLPARKDSRIRCARCHRVVDRVVLTEIGGVCDACSLETVTL